MEKPKECIRIIAKVDNEIMDIYEFPYRINKNNLPSQMILRVINEMKIEYKNPIIEIEFVPNTM